jgi:hypothetical protein
MITVGSDGSYSLNEDYYDWAQFSKFVHPGATHICSDTITLPSYVNKCSTKTPGAPTNGKNMIDTVAFTNPDSGSYVLVAMNTSPDPIWRSAGQLPVGDGPPGLSVLRCVSGPWCMAIYQNEAYVYSQNTWTKVADPPGPGLTDLSCVTTSFCMGVYSTTTTVSGYGTSSPDDLYQSDATVWNGHNWSQPTELDHFNGGEGYGVVQNVSCTALSFCMAIGGDFGSTVWNGSSWHTVSGNTTGTDGGTALSCTSASFCLATPASPNTIIWNGQQWKATQAVPGTTDWLSRVSCLSPNGCLATGTSPQSNPYIFNGTSWSSGPTVQGKSQTGGPLSCANLTYCVYSPSNGEASEFNGKAWSLPEALVNSPDYDESTLVSCAPTFCMAIYANRAFMFSVMGSGAPVGAATATPNFSSFAGSWYAHGRGVTISATGAGSYGQPDFLACSTCTTAGAPQNTVSFQLTSVSGSMATGTITSATDPAGYGNSGNNVIPNAYAAGTAISLSIAPASPGQFLNLTTAEGASDQLCDMTADDAGQCGA